MEFVNSPLKVIILLRTLFMYSLPIGPNLVPFCDSLIDSKYEPQKGTTLGPTGSYLPCSHTQPQAP